MKSLTIEQIDQAIISGKVSFVGYVCPGYFFALYDGQPVFVKVI